MLEMCKRVAARAGIPREEAYLHKWRAPYYVELLRQGVDLPSIQAAMGHKDLETTARYCAPLKKMALRERLDKVNSFNLKRNGLVAGNGVQAAAWGLRTIWTGVIAAAASRLDRADALP
jgi:hypothetical protein